MPVAAEPLHPARPEVHAEYRGLAEIAEIERAVAVEGEAEREAAALAHHLDREPSGAMRSTSPFSLPHQT